MKYLSIMGLHFTETVNLSLVKKESLRLNRRDKKKTIFNVSISYIIALLPTKWVRRIAGCLQAR